MVVLCSKKLISSTLVSPKIASMTLLAVGVGLVLGVLHGSAQWMFTYIPECSG